MISTEDQEPTPDYVPDHGHGEKPRRGCDHPDCVAGLRMRRQRDRTRKAATIVEDSDGRKIQTDPGCPHGTVGGYDNWLCRCLRCSDASTARRSALNSSTNN